MMILNQDITGEKGQAKMGAAEHNVRQASRQNITAKLILLSIVKKLYDYSGQKSVNENN